MHPKDQESLHREIEMLVPFIASVLVYPSTATHIGEYVTGGSVLLACSATHRFLVTAEHVIRKIDALRGKSKIVVLLGGAGAAPINITDWPVIDRSQLVDICTIGIPETFSPSEINKQFFQVKNWPPRLAEVEDRVIIVGYPAAHRASHGKTLNTRYLPIQDFVTDVGPRRFTVADEFGTREIAINPEKLEFPDHVGGMSGSPAFRVNEIDAPEMLGVFSEGSDGLRGTYFCAHANFLNADGKLAQSRLPPM